MTVRRRAPALLFAALALTPACEGGDEKTPATEPAPAATGNDVSAAPPTGTAAQATGPTGEQVAGAEAGDEQADPQAEAGADDAPPEAVPAKVAAAGEPGPAYFMVDDKGLVMLDAGKFTPMADSPKMLMKHFTRGLDGHTYALIYMDIFRLEGDKAVKVATADRERVGTPDDFAVDEDGKIYTISYEGIGVWDGKTWSAEPKSVLGEGVSLLEGVGVDASGQLWVASSNALHTKVEGTWKQVDSSKLSKRKMFFEGLEVAPDGTVYAWTGDLVAKLGPGENVTKADLGLKGFLQLGHLSFSQSGAMAFRTGLEEVAKHDGALTKYSAKKKQFKADNIASVTTDDQGRVWVSSAVGVAVLGPGKQSVEWLSGSVPEISGKVENIIVVGKGPELPEAGPIKTGGIKGKLLKAGQGLAGLDIELCPSPDMMFSKSPCHDSPVKFAVKSGEDGSFEVGDVPLGAYGIAIKVEGKWRITMGSDLGSGMKEGQVYDIGALTLD